MPYQEICDVGDEVPCTFIAALTIWLQPDFLTVSCQGDTESHSRGSERNKKMVPEVMTERNERTSTLDILEVAVSLKGVFKCLFNLNMFFQCTGKADDYKPFTFSSSVPHF